MRRIITLGIGGLTLALFFSMLNAQEKTSTPGSVESQFGASGKPRTTVQFFTHGNNRVTPIATEDNAASGVEQTGYKLNQQPAEERDYYKELFGESSSSTEMQEKSPVIANKKANTPSRASHISDYDEMLKSPGGTLKHKSGKGISVSDQGVQTATFQDSDNGLSSPVKTVAQFGQEPGFPVSPDASQELMTDEDLDLDEDESAPKVPNPKLGNPVQAPPKFPGAANNEPKPNFDWSDPPTKQPFPAFPGNEQIPFMPASSQNGSAQQQEIHDDQFQPFPQGEPADNNANPFAPLPPGPALLETPPVKTAPEIPFKTERAKPKFDQQQTQPEQVQSVISNLAPAGPSSPMVTIHWKKRDEINVGQPAVCDLVVENSGTVTAENVIVEAQFPNTVRLQDANPAPEDAQSGLIWMLGTLNANTSKTIQVTLIPLKSGDFAATAHVRFTGTTSGVFAVRQPMLKIVIEGPKQVMIGDPAPHTVTITNPGTGIAKNVVVQTQLPEGLDHPKGKQLMMQIGSINPGETRTIRLALSAIAGGTQPIQVQAIGDAGLKDTASLALNVVAPSLAIAVEGPTLRYKGRAAIYSISIKNTGTISSNNIKLMHKIPVGMDFVATDRGANYDATTRIVNWFVGRLNVGETTTLMVKLNSTDLGEFKHHVRVTSEQGTSTDAAFITKVEGLASLSVDVADIDDPVEVGEETAYEIKITNEGSKEATNLVIACDLPEGIEFLSAEGPTEHTADLTKLSFRPISSLAPGKTTTARVIVRGQKAGDTRMKVKVTSDSINDPVQVEELTRFYGDIKK